MGKRMIVQMTVLCFGSCFFIENECSAGRTDDDAAAVCVYVYVQIHQYTSIYLYSTIHTYTYITMHTYTYITFKVSMLRK